MPSTLSRKTLIVSAAAAGALALAPAAASAQPLALDPAPVVTGGDLSIDVAVTVPGGTGFPKNCDVTVESQDMPGAMMTLAGSDIGGETLEFTFAPLIPGSYTVETYCVNTNPDQDPPREWSDTQTGIAVTAPTDPQAIIDLLITYLS
ncbi:hypothetical protein [Lolliginicoccus suaedae]|uniref:hypothetical protein n=1 Tax=Lolliginicoccus suaedae TaxID=2605429 RepID=UPI0011EE802B|nr:hypothetical protein [Lolliginicoccus suaedae]